MLTVTTRHNRMRVIREKLVKAIAPDPDLTLELMQLEEQDVLALKNLVRQEGWIILETKMKEAIEEQKNLVFALASDNSENATHERMLRASIAECFSQLIEMVRGDIDRLDDIQRELKQRDRIAGSQDKIYSHSTLSRLRERVARHG